MGSNSKIRITVEVNEASSELFSIYERKRDSSITGDAIILIKKPADFGYDYSDETQVDEMRFSLHPSPDLPLRVKTLTHNLHTSNPDVIETRSQVNFAEPGSIWPLFSIRCSDLSADRYRTHLKSGDKEMCIDSFLSLTATLFYHVFVSLDAIDGHSPYVRGLTVSTVSLKDFHLMIIPTYINKPSDAYGGIVLPMTSAIRINKAPTNPDDYFEADAINMEGIFGVMSRMVDNGREQWIAEIKARARMSSSILREGDEKELRNIFKTSAAPIVNLKKRNR